MADWQRTRRTERENSTHYLYEFYDSKGRCLYVGLTAQPAGRISAHSLKPWWPQVTRIEATAYPDRETGWRHEAIRITELEPLHNYQRTEKAVGPRLASQ